MTLCARAGCGRQLPARRTRPLTKVRDLESRRYQMAVKCIVSQIDWSHREKPDKALADIEAAAQLLKVRLPRDWAAAVLAEPHAKGGKPAAKKPAKKGK